VCLCVVMCGVFLCVCRVMCVFAVCLCVCVRERESVCDVCAFAPKHLNYISHCVCVFVCTCVCVCECVFVCDVCVCA